MLCEQTREHLSAYLDRELTVELAAAVRDHLDSCAECRTMLEELRATRDLLGRLPVLAAPEHTAQDVQREIERRAILAGAHPAEEAPRERTLPMERVRLWPRALAVAATVILSVGIGVLAYLTNERRGSPTQEAPSPVLREEVRVADTTPAMRKATTPPAARESSPDPGAMAQDKRHRGLEETNEVAIANGRMGQPPEAAVAERMKEKGEGLAFPPVAAAKPAAREGKGADAYFDSAEQAAQKNMPKLAKEKADSLGGPAKPDALAITGAVTEGALKPAQGRPESVPMVPDKAKAAESKSGVLDLQIATAPTEEAMGGKAVTKETPLAPAALAEKPAQLPSMGAPAAKPATTTPGPAPAITHAMERPAVVPAEKPAGGVDAGEKRLGQPRAGKTIAVPAEQPPTTAFGAAPGGTAVAKAPAADGPPALGSAIRAVTVTSGPAAVQQALVSVSRGLGRIEDLQAVATRENLRQAEYQLVLVADSRRTGNQALEQLFRSNGWEVVARRGENGRYAIAKGRSAGAGSGTGNLSLEERPAAEEARPTGFYYAAPDGREDTWVVVTDRDHLSRFATQLSQVDALTVSTDSSGVFRPIVDLKRENLRRQTAAGETGRPKAPREPGKAEAGGGEAAKPRTTPEPEKDRTAEALDLEGYQIAKPMSPAADDGAKALGDAAARANRGKLAPADAPAAPGQQAGRGPARSDWGLYGGAAGAPAAPKAPPGELPEKWYRNGVGQEREEHYRQAGLGARPATGNQVLVVIRVRPAEAKAAARESVPAESAK